MGLIMKKDESEDKDYIEGIDVINSGEGPDGDEETVEVDVHEGLTAEDISGKTAAAEAERETEADPELLEGCDEDASEEAAGDFTDDDDAVTDEAPTAHHSGGTGAPRDPKPRAASAGASNNRHKFYIAGAVIAVIVAAIIGYVFGSGGFGQKGSGTAMLAENQLDNTVATWTINGNTHNISAREAIESQYSLDSVKTEDGMYPAPSAEVILSYTRNQVILEAAKKQGVSIDESELAAAAEKSLGTSDFEAIASQYQVSTEQAKEIVRQQAIIQKLYGTIVKDAPDAPTAPEEPADGDSTAASAEYAAYIVDLAGDEWDKEAGTWADSKGSFATAFEGDDFAGETATYEQAQKAYAAAYQDYAMKASELNKDWTSYVNDLFAKSNITLYGLFA